MVDTVLHDIRRTLLLVFGQRLIHGVVDIVHLIKLIPLDLTERLIVLPEFGIVLVSLGVVLVLIGIAHEV